MKRILVVPARVLEFLRVAPLQTSLILWFALFVAVGIKSLVYPDIHSVYPCYEGAARLWQDSRDLYDLKTTGFIYRYGPVFALSMVPLATLPSALGSLLWNWLNFGLFFATLWKLVQRGLPGDWTVRHRALFLSLALLGTTRTIWSGQSNLLVFSLVALATLAIQDRRWWGAAFLLAISVQIKVWPLAAALLLMAYWPWKLTPRFLAATLLIAAVPLLTKPWGFVWRQYVGWYDLLVGPAQIRHTYRDAWTLWEIIHEPVNAKVYVFLQLLSGAAVLGLCLWQLRRGLSLQRRLLFVLVSWAVWQMTFGPATERTTFGLIAPLSAWGLATAVQQRRGRVLMTMAFALMTCGNFGVIERARWTAPPSCWPFIRWGPCSSWPGSSIGIITRQTGCRARGHGDCRVASLRTFADGRGDGCRATLIATP